MLETWGEIATALRRGVSTVRRYRKRKRDPLPVRYVLGRVEIEEEKVHAWRKRQERARK